MSLISDFKNACIEFSQHHKILSRGTLGIATLLVGAIIAVGKLAGRFYVWISQPKGTTEKVNNLSKSSLDKNKINQINSDSSSKLHETLRNASPQDLRILLNRGQNQAIVQKKIEPNLKVFRNELKEHLKKYNFPLDDYADIEALQKAGHPLHFAAIKNDVTLLKLLIQSGADVNQVDNQGFSAIRVIIGQIQEALSNREPVSNFKEMIKILVVQGGRLSSRDLESLIRPGPQVFDRNEIGQIIDQVITKENASEILLSLLDYNDIKSLKNMIRKYPDAIRGDKNSSSLLDKALALDNIDLIELLVKNGAGQGGNVKYKDRDVTAVQNRVLQRIEELERAKKATGIVMLAGQIAEYKKILKLLERPSGK